MAALEKKKVLDVQSFLKTLESTNGRDKLGKLIQYTARLSAWYLKTYNPSDKEGIAKATSVQKGVASARKLTRLLKWWPLLLKLQEAFMKKGLNQPLSDLLRHLSSFGFANYFFWDGATWAIGIGLAKGDNAKFAKWAFYGWFVALTCAILADVVDVIKALSAKNKTVEGEAPSCLGLPPALCKRVLVNFSKNATDWCVAASGAQVVTGFSEGWLGLCGIIASLVGFYELWPAQ